MHNCSANIEITPDDELIPYIDEVKTFSMKEFGALPHLSIARDDRKGHGYLTSLSMEEYDKIWQQFNSDFWFFKKTIFNEKRNEFCYAGRWSLYVNLATGATTQCYCSRYDQNVFENVEEPIGFVAIATCKDTHCYNGHALLTLGCIPGFSEVRYDDIRNRIRSDGTQWIAPQMLSFLNSKLEDSNELLSSKEKRQQKSVMRKIYIKAIPEAVKNQLKHIFKSKN